MEKKTKKRKSNSKKRALVIFLSAFFAVVICFGAVFGIIAGVRAKNSVMRYKSVYLTEGVAKYFASTYKKDFIKNFHGADTPSFWAEEYEDGKTYGELLKSQTDSYIKQIVIGSYLFDRSASLSKDERDAIRKAASEVLEHQAEGNEKIFNQRAEKYGFDFDDFVIATEMMYKTREAKNRIYGADGSGLTKAECEEYFTFYSCIKLIFIRETSEFVTDEDGNRVRDEEGNDKTRPLKSEEILDRQKDIAAIAQAIEALKDGSNGQMSPEYFDTMMKKYSYNYGYDKNGYYIAQNSDYYLDFASQYPEIMQGALDMKEGEYKKFTYSDGVCFVYKTERAQSAYANSSLTDFFGDFYTDASEYWYIKELNQLLSLVEVKEGYSNIDIVDIPYNSEFFAIVEN